VTIHRLLAFCLSATFRVDPIVPTTRAANAHGQRPEREHREALGRCSAKFDALPDLPGLLVHSE
jgi:hypothetical protein